MLWAAEFKKLLYDTMDTGRGQAIATVKRF